VFSNHFLLVLFVVFAVFPIFVVSLVIRLNAVLPDPGLRHGALPEVGHRRRRFKIVLQHQNGQNGQRKEEQFVVDHQKRFSLKKNFFLKQKEIKFL